MNVFSLFLNQHAEMYATDRAAGLRSYRYRGVDRSPISRYILTPYWNWVVKFVPLWMAPNLVTLIGFMFMIAAYVTVLIVIPDLKTPVHPAFYFFFAACFWIYSTMDNIDGKQARRTNSSSPLGELFDHGCDALNCPIGSIIHIASLGLGFGWRSLIILLISSWAFYLPTWEEYHTGVLYLGYVNGPTEGLLAVITTILISGIFGPEIWLKKLQIFSSTSICPIDLIISFFAALFLLYYVPTCLYTVYAECKKKKQLKDDSLSDRSRVDQPSQASREQTTFLKPKTSSYFDALLQLYPVALGTFSVAIWLSSPHSTIQKDNFILFFSTVGIVFGKMATKIIYSHVAKCPFPLYTGMMLPLIFGSIVMFLSGFVVPAKYTEIVGKCELIYLWSYFFMCLIGYSNWIYHTIHSICLHCDIYCLKIKEKRDENTNKN